MDDSSQQIALKAFKVILVGTQSVGKSSILCRLISQQFPSAYQATVGIDYHTYNEQINNQNYCLQIWDTAGQQKFRALTSSYYKNCNGCLCVYDVSDAQSIQKCEYYLNKAVEENIPNSCTYIIGNKSDLIKKQNKGSFQDSETNAQTKIQQQTQYNSEAIKLGRQMAQKYEMKHLIVSAKNGDGINPIFHQLSNDLVKQFSGSAGKKNIQLLPKLKILQNRENCKC